MTKFLCVGATHGLRKKSVIETVLPLLRLSLMLSMMPLEMCEATKNYLTALLRNEAWNKFVMSIVAGVLNSGRFYLLPLDISEYI